MLKPKQTKVPCFGLIGKWHRISVHVHDKTLTESLNGKKTGSFTSKGISHPIKRLLRLSAPRQAIVDEVRIYSSN